MSCPNCFSGGISTSQPTGKEAIIHGVKTYVAEPPAGVTPKGIIVLITDAFGWDFVNNRVLCDNYAKGGSLVYCPDFMNGMSRSRNFNLHTFDSQTPTGHAMSPSILSSFDFVLEKTSLPSTIFVKPFVIAKCIYHVVPWIMACKPSKTEAGVIKFFQDLRTSPPPFETKDLKIGAAGFCWGGKHTVELAKNRPEHRVIRHPSQSLSSVPEALIDAAYVAHPTYIKVPEDPEAIQIPISWAVGENDIQMKAADIQKAKSILESKTDVQHDFQIIPGAIHGFAIRTHPDNKEELAQAQRAEEQAVSWFSRCFTKAWSNSVGCDHKAD